MSRPGPALVITLLLAGLAGTACGASDTSATSTTDRASATTTTAVGRTSTTGARAATTSEAPLDHPSTTTVLTLTTAAKAQLLTAFVDYKLTTGGLKSTDRVVWTAIDAPVIAGPLEAWDATNDRFYAFGNFTLTGTPSYAAQVSFQDGGSYGVFSARPGSPWRVSLGAIPVCRNLFPGDVAALWKLPNPPGCS